MKQFIKIVMTILICVGIGVSVTYLIREIDIQPSQMTLNDDNQFGDWKRDGRLTHGYGTYNHGLEFEEMTNIMVTIMIYLKIPKF